MIVDKYNMNKEELKSNDTWKCIKCQYRNSIKNTIKCDNCKGYTYNQSQLPANVP